MKGWKGWHYFAAAGSCVVVGGAMFGSSFHQTVTTELVTPYSTQAAHFTRSIPQPWQSLLRIGGGTLALIGGTAFAGLGIRQTKSQLLENHPEFKALPPSALPPVPNLQQPQPFQLIQLIQPQSQSQLQPQPLFRTTQSFHSTPQPQQTGTNLSQLAPTPQLAQSHAPGSSASQSTQEPAPSTQDDKSISPPTTPSIPTNPSSLTTASTPKNPPSQTNPPTPSPSFVAASSLQAQPPCPWELPVQSDEYDEVRELPDQGAVQLIGGKGSGKTEKLCYLIAEHIKQGRHVWFVNPFAPGIHFKGLRVFGRELNFRNAALGIRMFVNEAKRRIVERGKPEPHYVDPFSKPHIHLAIDEISNYGRHISEIDPELMVDFWEICTQFLRQVNMSVSMAGHGDTQAMIGGEKALRGKSKAIKRDIVRLYCQWVVDKSVQGSRRCAGWAQMVWVEGEEEMSKRISIPSWMRTPNPDYDFSELVVSHLSEDYLTYPDFSSSFTQYFDLDNE